MKYLYWQTKLLRSVPPVLCCVRAVRQRTVRLMWNIYVDEAGINSEDPATIVVDLYR